MKSPRKNLPPIEETTLGRAAAEIAITSNFEMSDEPFPGQEGPTDEHSPSEGVEDLGNPEPSPRASLAPANGISGDIIPPPDAVSYTSRIQIIEAFRYNGSFRDAPEWIDRNWLGHGDFDPLRQIEPGPCLRVPLDSGVTLARLGDYIVTQSVSIGDELPPEVRLEVWPAETFQKMFLPTQSTKSKVA